MSKLCSIPNNAMINIDNDTIPTPSPKDNDIMDDQLMDLSILLKLTRITNPTINNEINAINAKITDMSSY